MDSSIFNEIIGFLQNHSDGKAITQQSNISTEDLHKVAQEVVPKITGQIKSSPQSLGDLFDIFMRNKDDPQSLLNSKEGFEQGKAESEGNEILSALFGGRQQTAQMAEEVSQKTGVNSADISSLLPIFAGIATKILSGKATAASGLEGDASASKDNYFAGLLGFLDSNQDGSITDDLGRIGQQIIGNFLSGGKKEI